MPSKKEIWQTISLKPLTGVLDTRSRPADIPVGGFRWRQNFGCTDEGKICRAEGFQRLFPGALYDDFGVSLSDPSHPGSGVFYHNHDHHHQGATREAITFLFESTDSDGQRRLFDGTQSRISTLNEATGFWNDIATGKGAAGSRWQAAALQDYIVFTNNVDNVFAYQLSTAAIVPITQLSSTLKVSKAAVTVQYNGSVFVMNVVQDGNRVSSRVRWSDLNKPLNWDPSTPSTIASFQDLDYGEDILAAKEMGGILKIYTTRGIWNCFPTGGGSGNAYSFTRIYSEPKNQSGCLAYPNTLVSTGIDHYYLSRDAVYHFSPYIAEPERIDWIHKADGVIFKKPDTKLNPNFCGVPIGEYLPSTKEIWLSWSSGGSNNNWTLVLNIEQKSADVRDFGFNALVNYRPGISTTETCNESQLFIGASGRDWSLKQIGGILLREFVAPVGQDLSVDLPANGVFYHEGYYSILRGLIPAGVTDRDKIIRKVLVDDDVSEQDEPCVWRLRIANSFKLVDANDTDNICSPMWTRMDDRPIQCPDGEKISVMQSKHLRPNTGTEWAMYERGIFLYFELTVANAGGSAAVGGDLCLQRVDFELMAMPKPGA